MYVSGSSDTSAVLPGDGGFRGRCVPFPERCADNARAVFRAARVGKEWVWRGRGFRLQREMRLREVIRAMYVVCGWPVNLEIGGRTFPW